ncbi:MAG: alpha/beta fold hydrolase [Candidatus Heimdallarchaeota archaeon]|nr:MAG: alpha/beta fold hydrolase [Candidatus Heimdallarchaeota archaeon]
MSLRKFDPLIGLLLGTASVLLIISGVFGNLAYSNIHVDRIQLDSKGVRISALFLYPSDLKSQRPAILAYHGWGGTKENILTNCLDFVKAGFVVLVPDLRGHGESGGVSTLGLAEQADANVAVDYLISRSELVNSSAISVWGASFGGMISLLAAGNDPRIRAAIAVSAPANTTAWLKERDFRTNERISYRPYVTIDPSNLTALEERSPINYVNNIENLLVIHGELDPLVPVHHAEDLLDASNRSDSHKLIVFSGEEHNVNGDRVKQETTQFLREVFRNPHTRIINPPSASYLYLMASWITLLIGGLLFTISILSFFPIVHQNILSKWNFQKPSERFSFDESSLKFLVLIVLSFVLLHIASVLISLIVVIHYSTLIGLILSSLSTISLMIVGDYKLQNNKLRTPSYTVIKEWIIDTGITLFFILVIYFVLLLLTDYPWIPFINLETGIRLSPILIAIGIFLGIESLFYWELTHQFITKLKRNEKKYWYILSMSLIYLLSKCAVFFSLIIWWNLIEIRFIVYGFGLFGLLGVISAIIRTKWGFHSTLIFMILSGLTIYSVFSVLFLLL